MTYDQAVLPEIRAQAFLFDMDGTLIDSIDAAERVWAGWARRNGVDIATFLPTIHGARAVDTIGRLGRPDLDPRAEARIVVEEEIADVRGIVPIAGVVAFLATLPAGRWTIVTSAPRALARARLDAVGIAVPPGMVTGEDIQNGKPAPDCFLLGATNLGADIARCVVFEDAPVGIKAAEASGAGLVVVGAAHLNRASRPLLAINDFSAITVTVEDGDLVLRTRPSVAGESWG